jgi:heme-degrading monooxygenase HmoA
VSTGFHLAEVNIALPREPLDAPLLREFVDALEPVNALADGSPGFVWRLQSDEGDATAISGFDDERIIINMTVWRSLEDMRAFVYADPDHVAVMRRRREWFEKLAESIFVLWWVPAGHLPTVGEAERRLDLLRRLGPTPNAFTFREHFPAPGAGAGAGVAGGVREDRWFCEA